MKASFCLLCVLDRFGLNMCAMCLLDACVWVHMLATRCWWIVAACLCCFQSWRFHWGTSDGFVLSGFALWVHSVGVWMHMFAKLGWWTVVACRWLVNAGGFVYVSMTDVD